MVSNTSTLSNTHYFQKLFSISLAYYFKDFILRIWYLKNNFKGSETYKEHEMHGMIFFPLKFVFYFLLCVYACMLVCACIWEFM